jgi:hypothetical protein
MDIFLDCANGRGWRGSYLDLPGPATRKDAARRLGAALSSTPLFWAQHSEKNLRKVLKNRRFR